MAVGRISGPLLKPNLIRNGIDLAFETDLLYLDVNNQRIGIKSSTPQHELDVTGTVRSTNLEITNTANIADLTIQNSTISTNSSYLNLGTLDTVVYQNKLRVDSLDIVGNVISSNNSNANIELNPNGTGTVEVLANMNVTGNIHATGNISADGNITIGDANTDNITINADVASNLIPDVDNTYTLGTSTKRWQDVWVNNLNATTINSNSVAIDGIDLILRQGNLYYVAENGSDTNSGDHPQDPYASITKALTVATAGDTVHVFPGEYQEIFPMTIPAGVAIKGHSIRSVNISPTSGTNTNDAFLLNGETTVSDLTIKDFYNGYAFKFASNASVTSRSPYLKNITVITKGSVTTAEDPRGFNQGDAGKGVLADGKDVASGSNEASMLFHSCTFITPGVDAATFTNGVRIEWLNCFSYFANKGISAYDGTSSDGKYGDGKTRIRLSGISGTFTAGNTVTFTSTDNSTIVAVTVESVDNDILVVDGKNTNLIGFDTTPASISNGAGATATTIENVDVKDFGAEVRMIGSASVYGNFGLHGDGPGVIVYAVGQNLAYIGNGKEVTNDPGTVIQANEVVELNGAKIRYNSVDHKGDFRVGDLFTVDQDTGTVNFVASALNVDLTNGATFTTGSNTTFINGARIDTGNLRISGNTIESTSGNINFNSATNSINLNDNVNVTGNMDVTGNITLGGNIQIGDEVTDSITITAGINSNLVPRTTDTHTLGTSSLEWKNLYINELDVDDIQINTNFISTTSSNADLELRANGTGKILVPGNNVQVTNDLTVNGTTNLSNLNITGNFGLVGNFTETGDVSVTGDVTVSQDLTIGATAQFEEIKIEGNVITTTSSNADLELQANSGGRVIIPSNDVIVSQDLNVTGAVAANTITAQGNIDADTFTTGDIQIDDNFITTTLSNSNLELRANGTGKVIIPSNDIVASQNLTVNGTTTLKGTGITGTITHVGNTTQTGNSNITGDVTISQDLDVTGSAQFEEILIDDNYITTTTTNADLELRANGTGNIIVPSNDVTFSKDLTVSGTTTANSLNVNGNITATSATLDTFIVQGDVQLEDISIDGNVITTTLTNSDLDLRANGSGVVRIPSNDVTITNDLQIGGNLTVNSINSAGTLTANNFSTGDILIDDNFITTTLSNSNLELRTSGTGSVIIDDLQLSNSNITTSTSDITITPGSGDVIVNGTGAVKLPVGNTAQRSTAVTGQIRFNSELSRFEGYDGANWIKLNGLQDIDGDTRATAELTTGANDNKIRFYIQDNVVADINANGLNTSRVTVDDIEIDGNKISTLTTNTDLILQANGTGNVRLDNFGFNSNIISNTVADSVTTFQNSGNGYFKIDGTGGFVIPRGTSVQRPTAVEVGMIRYNEDDVRVEVYNGTQWTSVAGAAAGITITESQDIALELILSLG